MVTVCSCKGIDQCKTVDKQNVTKTHVKETSIQFKKINENIYYTLYSIEK